MNRLDDDDPFKDAKPYRDDKVVQFKPGPNQPSPPLDAYADEFGQSTRDSSGEQFREMSEAEQEAVPAFDFRPWGERDLAAIPAPVFVYSDFYARGYTSVTFAPPKVGKSMLGLAETIDMACGRGFLSGVEQPRRKVLYYNAEDDMSVIEARTAAILQQYGIRQSEISDTFFPVSGVAAEGFYMVTGQEGVVNERLFIGLEKFITQWGIDATIFDPLQDLSTSPETNEVFRILGQRLRRMASTLQISIGLIHHTRKIAPGTQPSIDDGRGGSALRGTSRFNRLLLSMTEDEAVKAGLDNHRHFMRISDVESNLAPPSSDVNRWFQKVSIEIPNGHKVGVVVPWDWPDAFDGVTQQQAIDCQAAILARDTPPRANVQSSDWVGKMLAPILHIDLSEKSERARMNAIIKRWLKEDVLRSEVIQDARQGRDVPVVVVGSNRISEA